MKLVVEQARRGISGAVVFSGKLSAFYSSGLAEEKGSSESGWKRGQALADQGCVRRILEDKHAPRAMISQQLALLKE